MKRKLYDLGLCYEIGLKIRFRKHDFTESETPYRSKFVQRGIPTKGGPRLDYDLPTDCVHDLSHIETAFACAEACLRREPIDWTRVHSAWDAFDKKKPDTPVCDVAYGLIRLVYDVDGGWIAGSSGAAAHVIGIANDLGIDTEHLQNHWQMAADLNTSIFGVSQQRIDAAYGFYAGFAANADNDDDRWFHLREAREILLEQDDPPVAKEQA